MALTRGFEVLGISRSEEAKGPFAPYRAHQDYQDGFCFVQADLVQETQKAVTTIQRFKPNFIVNFAAQGMVAPSWIHPEHWYTTNVVALSEITKHLSDLSSLTRFVQVTTPEVYGSTQQWISEDAPINPSTPYAISRAAGDMHLLALARVQGFPVSFTRSANVYGPGQQLYRIIPKALLSARLGRKLPIDGDGRSVRSFVYIDDAVDAIMRVMEFGADGAAYHVSELQSSTILEVVRMVFAECDVELEPWVEFVEERQGKDLAYLLDSSRIRNELNWMPKISLNEGLRLTLDWVDEHLELLLGMPAEYVHRV